MAWWSTLGKIGAGIAAPFTGGASLWAIPALGATGGAMRRDPRTGKRAGWKGAGIGGAIGMGEMFGGKALGALAGKIPGKPGDFISKLMTGGPKSAAASSGTWTDYGPAAQALGVAPDGTTLWGGVSDAVSGGVGNAVKGATKSKMSKVGDFLGSVFGGEDKKFGLGDIGDIIRNVGAGMGAGSRADAKNRQDEFDALMRKDDLGLRSQSDYDQLGLRAQSDFDQLGLNSQETYDRSKLAEAANRREDLSHAWKMGQYAEYMKGAKAYDSPTVEGYGKLPTFGFGHKAPTARELEMASTLSDQMLARLQPGGSYQVSPMYKPTKYNPTKFEMSDTDSLMKPGKGEKLQDWVARILGMIGGIRNPGQRGQTSQDTELDRIIEMIMRGQLPGTSREEGTI